MSYEQTSAQNNNQNVVYWWNILQIVFLLFEVSFVSLNGSVECSGVEYGVEYSASCYKKKGFKASLKKHLNLLSVE